MEFYEKPELEDLEHYGIKGMRWGVRRFANKLSRMETKYEKTRDKYVHNTITSKNIKPQLRKMTKQQNRLSKFMKKNEKLFNKNISSLSPSSVATGKKWLKYSNSSKRIQKNMRINDLRINWKNMLDWEMVQDLPSDWPKKIDNKSYSKYDDYAKRWRK